MFIPLKLILVMISLQAIS